MKRGLVILFCLSSAATVRADEPSAVPTFHNVGLYWSPDGGEEDREVRVRFRVPGGEWRDGLPLPYLPIEGTDLERADYRGSLVDLQPGTEYEVELRLEGTGESADLRFETWSEDFPEGERIEVEASSRTLVINESGTPDAYRVYDGGGQLFEVDGRYNINVQEARYVILRNFRLRGAEQHAIRLGDNVSDIVIEDNDISAWGGRGFQREFGHNAHAAVHSNRSELTRIVVQRNRIHHPNHDSNNWGEENCRSASQCSTHPSGPQAVGLYHSSGNHVIRFNEVFSDADHYYNDIFGGGDNGSFRGYPGPDSDLYGNYLANCWDDGIEVEGGVRNVRVYANYVDHCFQAIGNAPVSIGPLYVFRNVVGRSERTPGDDARGNFLKMGFASSVDWQRGFQYVFHNTLTNRDGTGFAGFGGGSRIIRHVISRNNVLFVPPSRHSISESSRNLNNDLDFDLFSSTIPSGVEENGMRGVPDFASGTFDDDTR
ncbi:MAG: right-handed parallel beta-helix repeat-containing protein, partial [Myxococcota bacterium]